MKRRQILWERVHPIQRLLCKIGLASSLIIIALLTESCRNKEIDRLTTVYGKVTDQAGQPVDSVTILFTGSKGLTAGYPIKETLTDSSGLYELVAHVPRKYHSAGVVSSLDFESLRSRYSAQSRLIYENGVQTGTCCFVAIGKRTKYDFVLLPK